MVCIAADKNEKAARAVNLPTIKTAMTSFGVMPKVIAHSIQNRLLYLLAKSQG